MPQSHPVKKFIKTPLGINITGNTIGTILGTLSVLSLVAIWTHTVGLWGKKPVAPLKVVSQTPAASQKPIVKVEASIQELRKPPVPQPPPFVVQKFTSLPKTFRGTATYKAGIGAVSGNKQAQSTVFFEWSVTLPTPAPDRKPLPQDSLKVRKATQKYNQANRLVEHGNSKNAAIELRFVITMQPNFAEAHNNLGIILLRQQEIETAGDEFEEALKLDPTNAAYNYNLILDRIERGDNQGLCVIPIWMIPEADLPGVPRDNGTFLITNISGTTFENFSVTEGIAGPRQYYPSPYSGEGIDVRDMVPNYSYITYLSHLGGLLPETPAQDNSAKMPDFGIQVSYALKTDDFPSTEMFSFTARSDSSGKWHWYPRYESH